MIFSDTPRTTAFAAYSDKAAKIITNTLGKLADWNNTRVTRNVLSQLSERELNDIGLAPGDIDRISRR
ncbi:MAG: DUF1127 domain-containing protein [Planktomarina sp.]|nr:DUF1127 domain-containing protein [Planktomarina sp.]